MNVAEKLRALFTTYQGIFQKAMSEAVPDTSGLVLEVPSTSASNTYGWLSQLADFRVFSGPRQIKSLKTNGYVVPNVDFELTFGIRKPDVEDDNLGIYTPLVGEMARKAAAHNARLAYGTLMRGLVDGAGVCLDNGRFFSKTHPLTFNADGTPITGEGKPAFSNMLWDDNAPANTPVWFVVAGGTFLKPILIQPRKAPEFVARTSLTDENVFINNIFQFGIDKRTGFGYGLPQLCVASNLPLTEENYLKARQMIRDMVGYDEQLPLDLEASNFYCGTDLEIAAKRLFNPDFTNATSNIIKGDVKVTVTQWLNIRTTIADAAHKAVNLDV